MRTTAQGNVVNVWRRGAATAAAKYYNNIIRPITDSTE